MHRCLAEGRKAFLERVAGISVGAATNGGHVYANASVDRIDVGLIDWIKADPGDEILYCNRTLDGGS